MEVEKPVRKLFAILLALLMTFSLAACGNNEDKPSGNEDNPGVSQTDNKGGEDNQGGESSNNGGEENNVDSLSKVLNDVGLTLESITPAEGIFDHTFDGEASKIYFYMEAGTKKDAAAYMNKVIDACKAVADGGKLYTANSTNELTVPEFSSSVMFYNFDYMRNGKAITVVVQSAGAEHTGRGDSVSYPTYVVTFDY